MANPLVINSLNIQQFGFKTEFLLEDKKIVFDITSFTLFNAGGANVVQGINFEVIDPSGIALSVIDFPNKDIDPATQSTYEVSLPNGFSQFGWYFIKGVIKDQDGKEYTISLKKNICKPDGFKNGLVDGKFDAVANCEIPKILITEVTNMAYAGLSPLVVVKNGVLYYPLGTLADIPFTFTPFEVSGAGEVYTGTYTVRNKSIATYDLGDLVYVKISYTTSKEFEVNCNSTLCKVLCCVDKLYETAQADCKSQIGKDAKAKLDKVAIPLMVATLKEKCGQSASDEIAEIEKILGCDCDCGNESVEPKPLAGGGGGGNSIIVTGTCASTVTPTPAGSTISYEVKTKLITVGKQNPLDLSFDIQKVEDACNIIYNISFNYENLANTILTTIKNSSQLTNLFNSIINVAAGIDLSGLDGKCIINLSSCDYTLLEQIGNNVLLVMNITIGGNTYAAPAGLLLQNDINVANWLNSLNKGVFNVFYDINTKSTIITSPMNSNIISTMMFNIQGQNSTYSKLFSKNCAGLKQILQAIINYICELSAKQVKLGDNLILCRLKQDGTIEQISYSGDQKVYDYLKAQSEAQCAFINKLTQIAGVDCNKIKSLFVQSNKLFTDSDYLLGTKEGVCAQLTPVDLADVILKTIFQTQEFKDYICQQIQNCQAPVCSPVDNVTVVVDNGAACQLLSGISGDVT